MVYIPCLRSRFAESDNEFDIREGVYLDDLADVFVNEFQGVRTISISAQEAGVSLPSLSKNTSKVVIATPTMLP